MKKKVVALLLIATMAMSGCAKQAQGEDNSVVSEVDQDTTTQDDTNNSTIQDDAKNDATQDETQGDMMSDETQGGVADTANANKIFESSDQGNSFLFFGGSPWEDTSIVDNIKDNMEVSEKDDFYLYNNYEWAKTVEIKPGYQSESSFTEVADEIKSMGMAVLTDKTLTGADAKLVRQLYDAYLDWDARNALGVKPAQETIDRIKAASTLDELTALFCDENSGVAQLFGFGASTGFNDSETYLLAVDAMGLYLGDSAEYARRTEQGERYEAAYRAAATKLFPKFGYSAAEADAMMKPFARGKFDLRLRAGDGAGNGHHDLRRYDVAGLLSARQQRDGPRGRGTARRRVPVAQDRGRVGLLRRAALSGEAAGLL